MGERELIPRGISLPREDASICIDVYLLMLRQAEIRAKRESGKRLEKIDTEKYTFFHLKNTI